MALPSNALTTVATCALELGLTVDATVTADLERRIGVASGLIEKYCGRKFGKWEGTERVAGHGRQFLVLPRYPILSVTLVEYDGVEVPTTEYELLEMDAELGHLRHATSTWQWTALCRAGASYSPQPGTERPLYAVTYSAGYVLPKDDSPETPRTLPFEVEDACIRAVVASRRSKGRDVAVLSESIQSASTSYASAADVLGASGLPLEVEAMLTNFRRLF